MRKVLFVILAILLFIGAGFIIANGFEVLNLDVLGMKAIKEKNDLIDNKNQELSTLVGTTFESKLSTLNQSIQTLQTTKKSYEDKIVFASDENKNMQTEKYEIEFLWTKLGNYAKDEKVEIKIDVTNGSTAGFYDLKFTVVGKYVNITEFIYDIENDSKLGFKIEDFHMTSGEEGVQGTFSCKEIGINLDSVEEQVPEEQNANESPDGVETRRNNTTNNANTTTGSTNSNIAQ
ncbi:MAG: hypothetical protein HFJ17_03960 [Clostridia bacterium]|nr:hypothetical protein [Clostridia bacterium]